MKKMFSAKTESSFEHHYALALAAVMIAILAVFLLGADLVLSQERDGQITPAAETEAAGLSNSIVDFRGLK